MSGNGSDKYKSRVSGSNGNGSSTTGTGNGNGNGNGSQVPTTGRGRGRAVTRDDAVFSDTTSDSEMGRKRRTENKTEDASKRGRSRDGRDVEKTKDAGLSRVDIARTKPDNLQTKKGTTGRAVNLVTNHFVLNLNTGFEFCQYRVDFLPELDDSRVRKAMIFQQAAILKGYVFDGMNLLYLTHHIDNVDLAAKSREGVDYVIKLQKTGVKIELTEAMGFMVLNTLMRRAMNGLEMQEVQRHLFDPKNAIDLKEFKLQLWPGYITSIRQHENNVLICCEISHKVMREETCLDVLRDKIANAGRQGGDHREQFEKEIVGTVVLTSYNNRTYSVAGVNWDMNPLSTFDTRDGKVSFKDYYQTRYRLPVREGRQPLLIARVSARDTRGGRDQPALLVPELCRTTGLTDSMRTNFHMMKALGEYTRMDPTKRVQRLMAFSKRLLTTPASSETLTKFGVAMNQNLMKIPGRVLNGEQILFGRGKVADYDAASADWTPAIRNSEMYTNETCTKWALTFPRKISGEVSAFLKLMVEVSNGFSYQMAQPKMIELNDDRVNSYAQEVGELIKKDPKLIMCVFMGAAPTNAVRYATIKKLTAVANAIPTQCILAKTLTPKKGANISTLKSVATKVVMQINCKLGGAPWMIKMPIGGVMTCGFDVSHSTANRNKSYGAFVASMDLKQSVKFFSCVQEHTNGTECSENIKGCMQKALTAYTEEHKVLPERILFYRDGVGEGQIDQIIIQEVEQLQEVLNLAYASLGTKPKFAFIVVSKRINARFFSDNNRGPGHMNPPPGTVVDDVVTLPERYDFFLVSQSVRQGTVSPTSYNIIHDTFGLTPDRLQQLTYKMCHLYYNWCGTTRVPAVVQYAHKLSVLVGQFMHQIPNPRLSQKLFFL